MCVYFPHISHLYKEEKNHRWDPYSQGSWNLTLRCQLSYMQHIMSLTMYTFKHGEEITKSLRTFWCTRLHKQQQHGLIMYDLIFPPGILIWTSRPPLRYKDFRHTCWKYETFKHYETILDLHILIFKPSMYFQRKYDALKKSLQISTKIPDLQN